MIKEISRKADGRVRDSVKRLRAQPHLVSVGDSFLINKLDALVSDLFISRETRWRRLPGKSRLVNLGWKEARNVGVNSAQFGSRLHTHQIYDNRAPVASLRHEFRVSKTLHQCAPGALDVVG